MKYLVLDKRQRIEISSKYGYVLTRIAEELEKKNLDYVIAYNDEITIDFINNAITITVQGQNITDFTHIMFRGMRLDKPLEYETRRLIVDYIEEYNTSNPGKKIEIQNSEAIKALIFYDKIWISKICTQNNIPMIDTHYKANGRYNVEQLPFEYPAIIKQYAGENDLRVIDGKEKIKKNVYLLESPNDYQQEFLKDKNLDEYIVQEFIPTGEDFRVFVKKGSAIAGFSRKSTKTFLTVNSGEYTKLDMNKRKDLKEFSERVAQVFNADFIAVDVMMKNEKPVLQEISFNPGFKAFETKTDGEFINLAKEIIEAF
ncbi:MAG: hypothetical protein UT34_C0001G0436 [candidate division WS6 bacterium GW2011_GWF2_39_15]|uniref:ATP-grasp domain-containing protein n=1 Tax=candidate division WS6 bacterium GW2011_GWF2_39_15 TaxID=1619100 RepID=A0A0G0N0N2_9BACT|nr:MAG: hypothetical protein UT34_C0001G0436 [candidate division WS6 bacterium GW2011_GWF2_39_15]